MLCSDGRREKSEGFCILHSRPYLSRYRVAETILQRCNDVSKVGTHGSPSGHLLAGDLFLYASLTRNTLSGTQELLSEC